MTKEELKNYMMNKVIDLGFTPIGEPAITDEGITMTGDLWCEDDKGKRRRFTITRLKEE